MHATVGSLEEWKAVLAGVDFMKKETRYVLGVGFDYELYYKVFIKDRSVPLWKDHYSLETYYLEGEWIEQYAREWLRPVVEVL